MPIVLGGRIVQAGKFTQAKRRIGLNVEYQQSLRRNEFLNIGVVSVPLLSPTLYDRRDIGQPIKCLVASRVRLIGLMYMMIKAASYPVILVPRIEYEHCIFDLLEYLPVVHEAIAEILCRRMFHIGIGVIVLVPGQNEPIFL